MYGVNLGKRRNNHKAAVIMRKERTLAGKPIYIGLQQHWPGAPNAPNGVESQWADTHRICRGETDRA